MIAKIAKKNIPRIFLGVPSFLPIPYIFELSSLMIIGLPTALAILKLALDLL